ncbi:MAG: hypothetical protein IT458_14800 [Planctomycetes bacterium]|nr:hypothetical protein [Planctomycetota bacterium]
MALAHQDTLTNLLAGVHVRATRQCPPRDIVRLESGDWG